MLAALVHVCFFFHTDIDECVSSPCTCEEGVYGNCSVTCENQVPGFQCMCEEGYRVDDLQTTCQGDVKQ